MLSFQRSETATRAQRQRSEVAVRAEQAAARARVRNHPTNLYRGVVAWLRDCRTAAKCATKLKWLRVDCGGCGHHHIAHTHSRSKPISPRSRSRLRPFDNWALHERSFASILPSGCLQISFQVVAAGSAVAMGDGDAPVSGGAGLVDRPSDDFEEIASHAFRRFGFFGCAWLRPSRLRQNFDNAGRVFHRLRRRCATI